MHTKIVSYLSIEMLLLLGLIAACVFVAGKKLKVSLKFFFFGVLGFLISQIIHLPLMHIPPGQTILAQLMRGPTLYYAVVIGLWAGLCEEITRFAMVKLKYPSISRYEAIAFGLGWASLEIIMVLGIVGITLFSLPFVYRTSAETLLSQGIPEADVKLIMNQIEIFKSQLQNVTIWVALSAVAERLFAIIFHTAFSLMAYLAVSRKKFLYIALAILTHTIINFSAVMLMKHGVLITEAAIMVFAILGYWFIMVVDNKPADKGLEA
ncbi:MAG: YhfC family glutamic-type intramembrane protease [bacterium]|nr:YhfC family glutamic-type intramembrane protease [bacterium]